jgi:ribosomal protein S21
MPSPDEMDEDRPAMQALKNSDWNGWHGNDGRAVDCSGKDIDQALKELGRRSESAIQEYEQNQHFTPPSEERRQEKQRIQHMLDNLPGKPPASGS